MVLKLKKPKRRAGEKPKPRSRRFKLPPFPDLRVPNGYTQLTEFIFSCEGEIPVEEAIQDFQDYWCDHPRNQRYLISTIAEPTEERYEHTVACGICGRLKLYQGRPSKELK